MDKHIIFQEAREMEKARILSNIFYLLDSPIAPLGVMRHSAVNDRAKMSVSSCV